jgi:hypothetical protein
MSVCNLAIRLAISKPIESRRLHYRSSGVMNQSALLSFQTILVDLIQLTRKTEPTLILAVIIGSMQPFLHQLGFGMPGVV